MVSAGCPNCKVILVEASSNSWSDLEAAEAEAVKLGATIVSNSYDGSGASESSYDTKGITYLGSPGYDGYALYAPATFKDVIAVGSTVLSKKTGTRGYGEVVWPDSGGGCSSTQEPKPSWQKDPDCSYRTGSDVASAAVDAAEYDPHSQGGTSISSPLVARMVALAGNSTQQTGGENIWKKIMNQRGPGKKLKNDIYPVIDRSDGSCSGEYLCTASTKQFGIYSGPTGWGAPDGVKAL